MAQGDDRPDGEGGSAVLAGTAQGDRRAGVLPDAGRPHERRAGVVGPDRPSGGRWFVRLFLAEGGDVQGDVEDLTGPEVESLIDGLGLALADPDGYVVLRTAIGARVVVASSRISRAVVFPWEDHAPVGAP